MKRITAIVRVLRLVESLPFCGVALLGGLMAARPPQRLTPSLGLAILATLLLACFAFAFNELQDVELDRLSETKQHRPLIDGSLSPFAVGMLCVLLLVGGLLLLALVTPRYTIIPGLGMALMGFVYSWRPLHLKTVPVLSTLAHLIFGTLVFSLGACSVGESHPGMALIGLYFGLVFSAGHLHHEVMDLEEDRQLGVKTHAVRFGARPTLWAGFTLWSLSAGYFTVLVLGAGSLIPVAVIQLGMFACYLAVFPFMLRSRNDATRLKQLQAAYRIAYMIGGFLIAMCLLLGYV